MDLSSCYSLGAQYLQGLVTGLILGYVFTRLYGSERDQDGFTEDESFRPSPFIHEGHPNKFGICKTVGNTMCCGDPSSEVKRALGDILNVEEASEPDKNTIIIRLTDASLLKLLSKVSTEEPDEYETIFNEVAAGDTPFSRPLETPVLGEPGSFGGAFGYRPLENFTPPRPKVTDPTVLSRTEERKILDGLKHIVGMTLGSAKEDVSNENMSLHVLYVGMGPKMPLSAYSSTTIGVRVKKIDGDADLTPYNDTSVITELIDVGGVDLSDYGVIKL